jgi:hypothetical protein
MMHCGEIKLAVTLILLWVAPLGGDGLWQAFAARVWGKYFCFFLLVKVWRDWQSMGCFIGLFYKWINVGQQCGYLCIAIGPALGSTGLGGSIVIDKG